MLVLRVATRTRRVTRRRPRDRCALPRVSFVRGLDRDAARGRALGNRTNPNV